MKVICIDNKYCKNLLSIGKIYEAISEDDYYYTIIDDDNDQWWYDKTYFKSLVKIRNEKIDKLLR